MTEQTYWNGEPCEARRVQVRIPEDSIFPNAWWKDWGGRDLTGDVVPAVEVKYEMGPTIGPGYQVGGGVQTFFLFDGDGSGWGKVTFGRGSPRFGHKSLPDDCEVVEDAAD